MERGFWEALPTPVVALAPMDGVTDAAFRAITDTYGKPHILFTEFTAVEAIARGATRVMDAFISHPTPTPVVAQVFGTEVSSYYTSAIAAAEMGFAGIDINMGCPAKNVQQRGAGAGLIRNPKLAQEIVRSVQRAMRDWSNGITMAEAGVHGDIIDWVRSYQKRFRVNPVRRQLPVSVKTRIGYDAPVVESWIPALLEAAPANITLHGRTLRQMYSGLADWDVIARAAEIVHSSGLTTTIMGNGDIQSKEDAFHRVETYGVDGVLIGRAAFGNPWLFAERSATARERMRVALEHAEIYMKLIPGQSFLAMRKHLSWYCKGFPNAAEVRARFVKANTVEDVRVIVEDTLSKLKDLYAEG